SDACVLGRFKRNSQFEQFRLCCLKAGSIGAQSDVRYRNRVVDVADGTASGPLKQSEPHHVGADHPRGSPFMNDSKAEHLAIKLSRGYQIANIQTDVINSLKIHIATSR